MAYAESYKDSRLRKALDAIDDASRLLGSNSGIDLPKVATVGDQSTGKSSVFESIFHFALPRGEGIVTRTPIQIEHRRHEGEVHAVLSFKRPHDTNYTDVWVEDLDSIDQELVKATDAVAGNGKGVVDSTIYLRVFTPTLPDFTIVDLPGITRNPLPGQDENIEQQIKDMIDSHVAGKMTVMLCVFDAGMDFAAAEAIKIARKHDKERVRTVGVATKIDLVDPSIDILAKLEGSSSNLQLKLGIFPVRNRTPQEIKDGIPLSQSREKELAYFESHPQLQKLLPDRAGVDALVATIVEVQFGLIESNLPKLKKQVRRTLESTRQELEQLSQALVEDNDEAWDLARDLLRTLHNHLANLRRGDYSRLQGDPEEDEHPLKVPRQVYRIAMEYRDELEKNIPLSWFLGDECLEKIKCGSKDGWGVALANFPMHPVFAKIFRERVHRELQGPATNLIAGTRQYMEEALFSLVEHFLPFGRLASKVKELAQEFLDEQEREAERHINLLIRQQEVIMTLNHYYMQTVNRIKQDSLEVLEYRAKAKALASMQHSPQPEADLLAGLHAKYGDVEQEALACMVNAGRNEDLGAVEMQISLMAYTKVVLKRVYDDVALGVRLLLVEEVGDKLVERVQKGLRCNTSGESAMLELMQDKHRADRCKRLQEMVRKLEQVDKTLSRVTL